MFLPTVTALTAALTLLDLVAADVQFTSPQPGATLPGGGAIEVEWKDSGNAPSIADLTSYQLFLCGGGNEELTRMSIPIVTTGDFKLTGNKASGTVSVTFGGPDKNAYYLRMVSVGATGGQVENYSARFTLSGMTGTFPPGIKAAIANIKGTDGPPTVNTVGKNAPGAAAPPNADMFQMAYTAQTGLTRYAPMQAVPPTKITKQKQTPLFPTSSVKIATTILPIPTIQTTMTQSQTFSVSSRENDASPAPMPMDDMQKFLNRWKD